MAKKPTKGRTSAQDTHARETIPLTPLLSRAELEERLFQQLFDVVFLGPTEGELQRKVGFVKIPEPKTAPKAPIPEELEGAPAEPWPVDCNRCGARVEDRHRGARHLSDGSWYCIPCATVREVELANYPPAPPRGESTYRLVTKPLGDEWPIHVPGARRGGRGSRPSPATKKPRDLLRQVTSAFEAYMWPEQEKKKIEDAAALLSAHGVGPLPRRRGKKGESVASVKRMIEDMFPVWDRYKALLSSLSSALGEHVKGGGHAPDEATEATIIAGLLIKVGVRDGATARIRGKVRQMLRTLKRNPPPSTKGKIGPVEECDPSFFED